MIDHDNRSHESMPSEDSVKRKQWALTASVISLALVLALFAYWSSLPSGDRGPERPPTLKDIDGKVVVAPGPADPAKVWRAKSEQTLIKMERLYDELMSRFDALEKSTADKEDESDVGDSTNSPDSEMSASVVEGSKGDVDDNGKPKGTVSAGKVDRRTLPAPPNSSNIASPSAIFTGGEILPPQPGSTIGRNGSERRLTHDRVGESRANATSSTFGEVKSGMFILDIPSPTQSDENDAQGQPRKSVDNYLPAGSFIKALTLSGLDAPTAGQGKNQDPIPFLLRLKDNGQLPNGFRSYVKHCHVTMSGRGNISDERAYGRSQTLSCVLKDGRILEKPLKAYLSGEDGKAGLRGKLISKQGQAIAYSLLAGLGSGLGEGISESFSTQSISALGSTNSVDPGSIAQYGLAKGAGNSFEHTAQWFLDRADELYPIIEIPAGRTPELVLLEGIYLDVSDELANRKSKPVMNDNNRQRKGALEAQPWLTQVAQ